MSYIVAIETAVPDYRHNQEDFTKFFSNATTNETHKRKINVISKKTGINTRYSVLKDYRLSQTEFEFYTKNEKLTPSPSLSKRMAVYQKEATKLSIDAVKKIKDIDKLNQTITHLI